MGKLKYLSHILRKSSTQIYAICVNLDTNQTFCVKSTRNVHYLGLKLYSILRCFSRNLRSWQKNYATAGRTGRAKYQLCACHEKITLFSNLCLPTANITLAFQVSEAGYYPAHSIFQSPALVSLWDPCCASQKVCTSLPPFLAKQSLINPPFLSCVWGCQQLERLPDFQKVGWGTWVYLYSPSFAKPFLPCPVCIGV